MRRLAIPVALIVVIVSGLALLSSERPPDAAPSRDGKAPAAPREPSQTTTEPVTEEAPVAVVADLEGLLWQTGGAPVAGLALHLLGVDGALVRRIESDERGGFRVGADALALAGPDPVLEVNPAPRDDRFRSLRMRVVACESPLVIFVARAGRPRRFELVVEVRGADPDGDPIRVGLQGLDGHTAVRPLPKGATRLVVPRTPVGEIAAFAVQGDRAAYLPPRLLSELTNPLLLDLDGAASLRGRVVDAEGAPVADATVLLVHDAIAERHLRGQAVYETGTVRAGASIRRARTDVDGRFRIDGLYPALFRLDVRSGDRSHRRTVATLKPGEARDVRDVRLSVGGGKLRAAVRVSPDALQGAGQTRLILVEHLRGEFRSIPLGPDPREVDVDDMPPGMYAVVVARVEGVPGGGDFRRFVSRFALVEIAPGEEASVELTDQP